MCKANPFVIIIVFDLVLVNLCRSLCGKQSRHSRFWNNSGQKWDHINMCACGHRQAPSQEQIISKVDKNGNKQSLNNFYINSLIMLYTKYVQERFKTRLHRMLC